MGQGLLSGQVAPPARPYSLRADLAAWRTAVRGLRDNPLLTHLRLAERRRLRRTPLWRRSLPLVLIVAAVGALVLFQLYIDSYMIGQSGYNLFASLIPNAAALWMALWFVQGVFQAVLGALGVLGRWHKRPSHLVLDDFASLTNLTDHEIAAGAVASLLPALTWRIGVGSILFVALPALNLAGLNGGVSYTIGLSGMDTLYDGQNLFDSIVTSTLSMIPLGLVALALGALAAIALIMWFICLGRSINVEKIGILSASVIAISQTAYPGLYINAINMDPLPYNSRYCSELGLESLAVWILLTALAPVFLGYLLALARRLPWVRVALTVLSPLVLGAMLVAVPFFIYSVADALLSDHFFTFFNAVPSAVALATGAMAVLAPLVIVLSCWIQEDVELALSGIFSILLLLLEQLCILYIISRFTIEAVGARRRRGE